MAFPKVRLAVSGCLFLLWIGYLFFLVVDSPKVILSLPQFQSAHVIVVAHVNASSGRGDTSPRARVTVLKVLWSADAHYQGFVDIDLGLPDLATCTKMQGYRGAGEYLLPLVAAPDGTIQLAPVPRLDFFGRQSPTHGTVEGFGFFSHPVRRRLPMDEAQLLYKEMKDAGYDKLFLTAEELRIYPWTPDTRRQVESLISAK